MKKNKLANICLALVFLFSLFSCRPPEQEESKEESYGAALVKVFQVINSVYQKSFFSLES